MRRSQIGANFVDDQEQLETKREVLEDALGPALHAPAGAVSLS